MATKSNYKKKKPIEPTPAKAVPVQKPDEKNDSIKITFWLLLLVLLTFFTYYRATQNSFTNWDDEHYVLKNNRLHSLSPVSLKKMFFAGDSSFFMGNYHPFSVASLAVDYHFCEKNKAGEPTPYLFILHNILLHVLNSVLVFFFLFNLVKLVSFRYGFEVAMVAAFVFGVHTLHVESVAWVSERKDVLYQFYFIASLLSYVLFLVKKKYIFFGLSLLLFIVSCFAKGQAVSLALSLVAIDFFAKRKLLKINVIAEKIPFFAISLVFGLLAVQAQKTVGAFYMLTQYSILERLMVASYGVLMYVLKLFYPFSLSADYPYLYASGSFPLYWYLFLLAPALLGFAFYWFYRKSVSSRLSVETTSTYHGLAFVLLFFVVNIVLLLQFIPVGGSLYADRYVYISSVAFAFFVGLIYKMVKDVKPQVGKVYIGIVVLYVGLLTSLTFDRISVWKDSITLWTDVIEKDEKTILAYANRGDVLKKVGRFPEAIKDFTKAIAFEPKNKEAHFFRGMSYKGMNKPNEAIADFNKAIQIDPNFEESYLNRGLEYDQLNRSKDAISDYTKAMSLNPMDANAYLDRGACYGRTGKLDSAITDFKKALALNSNFPDALSNLASIYAIKGQFEEAVLYFDKAILVNPGFSEIYFNRALAYHSLKKENLAIADLTSALTIKADYKEAYLQRGEYYKAINKKTEACSDFHKAQQLGLNDPLLQTELASYCGK